MNIVKFFTKVQLLFNPRKFFAEISV